MTSSKSPPTLHSHSCGFPGCSKPAPLKCSRCLEVRHCSKEHQKTHWRIHKKLCAPPGESLSWPAVPSPAPPAAKAAPPIVSSVAAPGSFAAPAKSAPVQNVEEVDDSDKCIICMDRVVNVKFKACSHSMTAGQSVVGTSDNKREEAPATVVVYQMWESLASRRWWTRP